MWARHEGAANPARHGMGPRLGPHVGRQMLGKIPGHQKECLTGFNGEVLPGGVPGPERGRPRKSAPGRVGGGFYTFVVRDGQARWTGVQIGCQAKALQADRSFYMAGVGWL